MVAMPIDIKEPDFSTNEVATGLRWVDGKMIYRKVWDIGGLPNAGEKSIYMSYSRILKVEGYGFRPKSSVCVPIPMYNQSAGTNVQYIRWYAYTVQPIGGEVNIQTNYDASDYTEAYAVIYYTK